MRDNAIVAAEGRDGPANHGRLCVKGRYGYDYARHPQRLPSRSSASRARRNRSATRWRISRGELGGRRSTSPPMA
ncbi:MAG: hypothetical protein M5R42_15295 [Rhodocyclaceae bacterium]|nr:hypothetical protein [Rhodocyclaceae bacterium]